MKKRIIALVIAALLVAVSLAACAKPVEDVVDDVTEVVTEVVTEEVTEVATEVVTEAVTEEVTEEPTEAVVEEVIEEPGEPMDNLLLCTTVSAKGFADGAWLGGLMDSDDEAGIYKIGVWTAETTDGKNNLEMGRITFDETEVTVSNRSLRIENEKDGVNTTGFLYVPGLKPGTRYILQGWVKTDIRGEGLAHFRLSTNETVRDDAENKFYNTIGEAYESEEVTGRTNWKRVSIRFTTPKDQDCYVLIYPEVSGKGVAWFDGLAVVESTKVVDDALIGYTPAS